MVVQDGRNLAPRERQNYKLVSWRAIADSLGLD
jgi:myo-inositol-hexaphosphate 3-phosphohydrolase